VQKFLDRQGGDAALCFMSEKYRANRFCVTWCYSADQNSDKDDDEKTSMYSTCTIALHVHFLKAIYFWGVTNEPSIA